MRLGINHVLSHNSPEQWAEQLRKRGLGASVFPVDYKAPVSRINAYVNAAKAYDITIAEVGVWNSPLHPHKEEAKKALERCEEQLRLADYVKARCCVNVSGGAGTVWFGCYKDNYSQATYDKNIEIIQNLCDKVKPQHTYYTLEIMQWMLPDSADQYLQFINDVNRDRFAVHMDVVNLINNPYNYTHHNEVIERAFSLLGNKVKSCHLKDCAMGPGTTVVFEEVPCGNGILDIPFYAKKINEVDEDMPLLIEHLKTDEDYYKSLEYVIPLLKNAGVILK